MKNYVLKRWYRFIGKSPAQMPMVSYWKHADHVEAKVTTAEDGSVVMVMDGEKYPHPGFPRGHLLISSNGEYAPLSVLKHNIKTKVFNDSWWALEEGKKDEEVIKKAKKEISEDIFELFKGFEYDVLPFEKLSPAMKEFHRVFEKSTDNEKLLKLRDIIVFILQEDDGYRFRFQWMCSYMVWLKWLFWINPFSVLEKALIKVEHAEVIGDMKERIQLLRRILLLLLSDPVAKEAFVRFCKTANWKKMCLSGGDKYHFRGKYFKVDHELFDY